MNSMPPPLAMTPTDSYDLTRFNALRHGILSRFVVLPWEDGAEYQSLLEALVAEHLPVGPTEEHLVEEISGIIWRKRRLRIAEAAVFREKLRHDATGHNASTQVAGAALLPITGSTSHKASIAKAVAASPGETARELREVKRDRARTLLAWNILSTGEQDAYPRALAALRADTRTAWLEDRSQPPEDDPTYAPNADSLKAWLYLHWKEWYEQPIAALEHRDAIRDHALGVAYAAPALEVPAKYEVHLDRKLERTLAMLIRLRDLRRESPTV